jgi:uncharacterized protein
MIRFTAQSVTVDAAAGEEPTRTISGIAVPYGVEASVSTGQRVRVEAGALPTDGPAPRLLQDHDPTQVIGMVTAREDTPEGMLFSAKIAKTRAGDDLLELLQMGAYDSVSIGIEPTDVEQDGRTTVVKAANWSELSVVYQPAFEAAKITQIAASQDAADPDEPETPNPSEEDTTMSDQTPEVVEAAAPVVPAPAPIYAQAKKFTMPSASEYIAAALEGGHRWHLMNDQIKAAAPDVTTTNNDGVLPEPILGPVYDNFIGERPLVDSFGVRAMPAGGKIFIRPSVATHTSIGNQASELATLTAGQFQVQENSVTKGSYGGYVDVSEQLIDWSSPEIISLILQDMGKIYANQTDTVACAAFEAAVTQTATLTAATDAANWVSFIFDAAKTILTSSNGNLPNVLVVSPDYWANLGALSDDQGRPLFPQVGPMNALGNITPGSSAGIAFGLEVVVDRNLVAAGGNNVYVGRKDGFEIFETTKGFLSVDNASNRSRTISWLGYFATLMIDDTKFVTRAS